MFSPSSFTNQSIRTKCLCDGRDNQFQMEQRLNKKEGERQREVEEGGGTGQEEEMGGKMGEWLSVCACVITFDLCTVTFMV